MGTKNVLLLGGTGTLSTAVLNKAAEQGYRLWVLNRGIRKQKLPNSVQNIIGDFKNTSTWVDKIRNLHFDIVVDFLSRLPIDIERVYPIFKNHCEQYIFISTSCVYRRANEDFPIKESSPKPNKDWEYNTEKYEAEKMLIKLSHDSHNYYTIVRPYITYDKERIPFGITPAYKYHRTIIERIKSEKPMFVWNGGNSITTLTYVDDFANGVVGLFLNENAKNEDFHITSNFQYTWQDFWRIFYDKMNIDINIVDISVDEIGKVMPNEKNILKGDRTLDAVFDNSKIKAAVPSLKFEYNLEAGIDEILRHYNNSKIHSYDYMYDALLDKMLSHYSSNTHFVKYPNAENSSRYKYLAYRYLPIKIANKLCRLLKIK